MTKGKVFLVIIAVIVVAVSAYPLEDNVAADEQNPSKANPLLAGEAQQKQNDITKTQDLNSNDDSKQDTAVSSESTETSYIEETYIEVLLPFVPRLNTTELETVLNRTANHTNDNDRLKRSSDSDEDSKDSRSLEDVSTPSSENPVPSVLYTSGNSNTESEKVENSSSNESSEEHSKGSENVHDRSESSEEKSKDASSSTVTPSLYQLRNINARSAGDAKKTSSSYSEESSEEKENSSSNEDSSKEKKPFSNSSRQVREAVENKDKGALQSKDSSEVRTQQSQSTSAPQRPLYSAQNFYSRPSRQASGKDYLSNDNSESESSSNKNSTLLIGSNNQDQKTDVSNSEVSKSFSKSNVAPALYSTHYSNVRKVREVVDSSEEKSSGSTADGPVLYVTPQSGTKSIPKEATVSASPAVAENVK